MQILLCSAFNIFSGDYMKLFLRRDTSKESSRFIICDEQGADKYSVSGKRTASTDRMTICNTEGMPLVTVRVAPFHVFYAFSISDGHERFTMTATRMGNKIEFRFHGISWSLCQSCDLRSFEIIDADKSVVMLQSADRFLSTGALELTVYNEHRELFCIAAAICVNVLSLADAAAAVTV